MKLKGKDQGSRSFLTRANFKFKTKTTLLFLRTVMKKLYTRLKTFNKHLKNI